LSLIWTYGPEIDLDPLLKKVRKAAPRLIPPTIMSWEDGPPPTEYRLPIDDELRLLADENRRPGLRSPSAILVEFPTLNWDGPYRAARYYLYDFSTGGIYDDDTECQRNWIKTNKAHIDLLSDVQISLRRYVEKIDLKGTPSFEQNSRWIAWYENFLALKKAIGNAEFLEQFARESLGGAEKGGRPPIYWKSGFVLDLAELWRIMTGNDASKDLASPFSSFVAAAWASLGDDLREVSWASQIRRRDEMPSASKLVARANNARDRCLLALEFSRIPVAQRIKLYE
jgi:hypothetical protein